MQKCGEDTVYLHGECNVPRCDARSHLYQIDVSELPVTNFFIGEINYICEYSFEIKENLLLQ